MAGGPYSDIMGQPQKESESGGDPFANLYRTPEKLNEFLSGMTGISLGA